MGRGTRAAIVAVATIVALPAAAVFVFLRAQERDLDALEAELRADLEEERRNRIERRPPLRGDAEEGEALSGIVGLIMGARCTWECEALYRKHLPCVKRARLDADCVSELADVRTRLGPVVASVRSAIQAGRVEREEDVGRLHQSPTVSFQSGEVWLTRGFVLEALHALREGRPLEAAEIALDRWRVEHDLGREGGLINVRSAGPGVVLPAAVSQVDDAGLAEIEREVVVLVDTAPSFAMAVRRDRLRAGCRFRAVRKGEVDAAFHGKGLLRKFSFARHWRRVDEDFRRIEEAVGDRPQPGCRDRVRPLAGSLRASHWPPELGDPVTRALDLHLCDQARLRVARLMIACERFRRARGRWPASQAEALGREPAPGERDPFDGKPLRVSVRDDGGLVVSSIGPDLEDGRGADESDDPSFALAAPGAR